MSCQCCNINSAVFPGTQGGPLEHVIAAKAVCFGEALKPEFKDYARKIVENAQAMAAELQARGVKLVSGGTEDVYKRQSPPCATTSSRAGWQMAPSSSSSKTTVWIKPRL